jgi:hypothetical protein
LTNIPVRPAGGIRGDASISLSILAAIAFPRLTFGHVPDRRTGRIRNPCKLSSFTPASASIKSGVVNRRG